MARQIKWAIPTVEGLTKSNERTRKRLDAYLRYGRQARK